jgi:hypothetical protein
MKTNTFTGLVFAAALLAAGPAFASNHRAAPRGHAVAASHAAGGHARSVAAFHGGGRSFAVRHAARPGTHSFARSASSVAFARTAAGRTKTSAQVARSFAGNNTRRANRSNFAGRAFNSGSRSNSVAFGGNSRNYSGGNRGNYQYAFADHRGWDHGREYDWDGHHYQWYDNAWYIVDPYPYYAGYPYNGGYGSTDISVRVQGALSAAGYYNGPVDGIVGNGTRAAIAAYQRDYGLRVTGTITPALLNSLGVS